MGKYFKRAEELDMEAYYASLEGSDARASTCRGFSRAFYEMGAEAGEVWEEDPEPFIDSCPICGDMRVDGLCFMAEYTDEVLQQAHGLSQALGNDGWWMCVLKHFYHDEIKSDLGRMDG